MWTATYIKSKITINKSLFNKAFLGPGIWSSIVLPFVHLRINGFNELEKGRRRRKCIYVALWSLPL
jgi:hypothetical protein